MKVNFLCALAMCGYLCAVAPAFAASAKNYQVTGTVVEASDSLLTIEKGKDKWEIKRDAGTKISGDIKPGAKVTIQYAMTATAVDVKEGAKTVTKEKAVKTAAEPAAAAH